MHFSENNKFEMQDVLKKYNYDFKKSFRYIKKRSSNYDNYEACQYILNALYFENKSDFNELFSYYKVTDRLVSQFISTNGKYFFTQWHNKIDNLEVTYSGIFSVRTISYNRATVGIKNTMTSNSGVYFCSESIETEDKKNTFISEIKIYNSFDIDLLPEYIKLFVLKNIDKVEHSVMK